jgi:hypothetical protein
MRIPPAEGGGLVSALVLQAGEHRLGDLALVERPLALAPQDLERVAELGIAERLPLGQRSALGRVEGATLRGRLVDRGEDLDHVGLLGRQRDALARRRRARRHQLGERHGAKAPGRLAQPGWHAEGADRGRADVEDLNGVAEGDADRQQLRAPRSIGAAARRLDEEVEQHRFARAGRDEHVSAAPQPGQAGLGTERDARRRDRGVDRVAARGENVGSGLSGAGMAGGDDAAHGVSPSG